MVGATPGTPEATADAPTVVMNLGNDTNNSVNLTSRSDRQEKIKLPASTRQSLTDSIESNLTHDSTPSRTPPVDIDISTSNSNSRWQNRDAQWVPPSYNPYPLGDTCGMRSVTSDCQQPRSCTDCLDSNTDLNSGCFLDATNGRCLSMSELPSSVGHWYGGDGTNAAQWSRILVQNNVYWAQTFQYCKASDASCTLCRQLAKSSASSSMAVCTGVDGCICVAACEKKATNTQRSCTTYSPDTGDNEPSFFRSSRFLVFLLIAAFILLQLTAAYAYYEQRRRRRRHHRSIDAATRRPPARVGPYNNTRSLSPSKRLQLSGWSAWQRQLCERERRGELPFVRLMTPRPSFPSLEQGHDAGEHAVVEDVAPESSMECKTNSDGEVSEQHVLESGYREL